MKKLIYIMLMGVLMATFAACSNDDDPMGIDDNPSAEFTFDYFEGLIHNKGNQFYEFSDFTSYLYNESTEEWEEVDPKQYTGWCRMLPKRIAILNGQVYKEPIYIKSSGNHPVYNLWLLYLRACPSNYGTRLYYPVSCETDKNKHTVNIAGKYDVLAANDKKLTLNVYDSFRQIGTYNAGELLDPNDGKTLLFDSLHDLMGYILKTCHEKFGDVVNRNEVYYPEIQFQYAKLNIAKLIEYWENGDYDKDGEWVLHNPHEYLE